MVENVEITVKVNGESVPLSTISTETFEKIKRESEPKKVPIMRVVYYSDNPTDRRLLLKVPENIGNFVGMIVAIDVKDGAICNCWPLKNDNDYCTGFYNIVKVIE